MTHFASELRSVWRYASTAEKRTTPSCPQIAHPYWKLKAAGYELVAASPKGGEAPLDQASVEAFKEDEESTKFLKDAEAQSWVKNTKKLSEIGDGAEYKALFYPGGHGPVVRARCAHDPGARQDVLNRSASCLDSSTYLSMQTVSA